MSMGCGVWGVLLFSYQLGPPFEMNAIITNIIWNLSNLWQKKYGPVFLSDTNYNLQGRTGIQHKFLYNSEMKIFNMYPEDALQLLYSYAAFP